MGLRDLFKSSSSPSLSRQMPTTPPRLTHPAHATAPTQPSSAMSESQVAQAAPGKLNLYKSAGLSLRKKGLLGERAAVYFVLDRSASMNRMYADGTVTALAERVLALSAHFDDDGIVPTWLFGRKAVGPHNVDLSDSEGAVERLSQRVPPMGVTNYAPAIRAVAEYHMAQAPHMPAYVVFQTDGDATDRADAVREITWAAGLPIFWQFLGCGGTSASSFSFLNALDDLDGRVIDNAGFFWAGSNPNALSDDALFDGLMNEFPEFLRQIRG